ncbi:MAG: hypothetical protein WCK91_02205, partial [bacterium]
KIYRTAAALLVTDTPYLVTTLSDNATTSYVDGATDASLGVAFGQLTPSGPVLSRGETTRVESVNNQLTLPWGRLAQSQMIGTTGFYQGLFNGTHPNLNSAAGIGTFVIARDDKTFLVVEGGNGSATADLYDPATQSFTAQSGTGNVPTAAAGAGSFAIKRPDGKFLVVLGAASGVTNIYDQYAPAGSRFTLGPTIAGTAPNQGAFAIQNMDGTYTILPGNAATTTSIYDPVRNTMTAGPLQITGTNMYALALPYAGANTGIYKVAIGVATPASAVVTTTMNYNSINKIFTAGANLAVGIGAGAFAFQRQDGIWVIIRGDSTGALNTATGLFSPATGIEAAGLALTTGVSVGASIIPRADGTFLLINGGILPTVGVASVATQVYIPWGGVQNATLGVPQGTWAGAGPNITLQGNIAPGAAAPTVLPASGGSNLCDSGTHLWRYTYVINGVESAMSINGTVQTCTVTTLGQETLTGITTGPTGTTARKLYRTKAGQTTPYFLVPTGASLSDNSTTTFADSGADSGLGAQYWSGATGLGTVSFQRPDGKIVIIYGGVGTTVAQAGTSTTVGLYDAGWYADGQYLSEEMNVPALAANSTLDWQQTPDQYVRMAARTAASQGALGIVAYTPIATPGGSIGNVANDTWAQVQVNFRRDFPTYPGVNNGVYNSSNLAYAYRSISLPTVNSYQITNGMDLINLQTNGLSVLRVTSDGNIMSSTNGAFFSGGADLAENYTSTQTLTRGEVVIIDPANSQGVLRSTGQYQNTVVGVVSSAPGFVAGSKTVDSVPIALVGRVPVRFSTENGPIKAGDYLTSASIPGYAMRATQAGRVIGTALENMDSNNLGDCPSFNMGQLRTTKCGIITVFVNLANYSGASIEMLMQEDLDAIQGASLGGLSAGLEGDMSNLGTLSLSSNVSGGLTSSVPKSVQLSILDFLIKIKNSKSGNQNISEIFTDRVAAAMEIITPQVFTDGLTVNTISSGKDAVTFMTDTIFFGRPYFTTDTAGFAKVSKGDKKVDVVFDKEYLEQPIVNATITVDKGAEEQSIQDLFNDNVQFLVVNKSEKGFTIILKDNAKRDINFSWTSFAVKSAKTFSSKLDTPSDIAPDQTVESNPTLPAPQDQTSDTPTTKPVPDVIVPLPSQDIIVGTSEAPTT